MNEQAVSLEAALGRVQEQWSPKVIARFDDYYLKVAKVQGSLAWHAHEHEDEVFLVLKGTLTIEMKDKAVVLRPGELYVVPKGVQHNPVADEECELVLIERASTLHTGDVVTDRTRSLAEQLGGA
jgi:mannose-6-phosphate isomerase-like protein (cupin superfamily)